MFWMLSVYECSYFLLQIKANPYMYDNHVELIKLLSTSGDFDKMRAARETMNVIFPLTEGTDKIVHLWTSIVYHAD